MAQRCVQSTPSLPCPLIDPPSRVFMLTKASERRLATRLNQKGTLVAIWKVVTRPKATRKCSRKK